MEKSSANLNVLITDDQTLFRKGMVMIVQSFKEVKSVQEASNGKEALKKIKEGSFDVLLLDLEMPLLDGWDTAKSLIISNPELKIIMVSNHDSLETISKMIEMGVHSYLLKSAEPNEVYQAILSVVENDFFYNKLASEALRKNILRNKIIKPDILSHVMLSNREIEIMQSTCLEYTVAEIADKLHVSEETVRTHRKNLMKKIGAKNSISIVRFALKNGIVHF